MRVVKEIPGEEFNLTIYSWNNKFLLKYERGFLEQTFKIPEMDLLPGSDIATIALDTLFTDKVLSRFNSMQEDFGVLVSDFV